MQTKVILFLVLLLSIVSCKKDEEIIEEITPIIEEESTESYSQLEVGNYWVYQRFAVDKETGEVSELNIFDSIYVETDTIINDHQYHILRGSWFGHNFGRAYRNDGVNLINPDDKIFMTTRNIFDTLSIQQSVSSANIDSVYFTLTNYEENLETPAGTFYSAHQYERVFFLNPQSFNHDYLTRYDTEYYTKDIGVVKYTSFFASEPVDLEMRLIRYSVD